jgi:hypothetical protein
MSKRTRKTPARKAAPKKAASTENLKKEASKQEISPPVVSRSFESSGWLEGMPVIENWFNLTGLTITDNTCASQDYGMKTIRAALKVMKGIHYFEVRLVEGSDVRIGWALDNFKPREYDGLGCDVDSWGWDCQRQKIYHNVQSGHHYSYSSSTDNTNTAKQYGQYCSSGDIIGCTINFEDQTISYQKNADDMGVAFKLPNFKQNAMFHPTFSVNSRAKIQVLLGPTFSYRPRHAFGLNATMKSNNASDVIDVFQKYQQIGLAGAQQDSQSLDNMKQQGVLQLASDLGSKDVMDPHILILAWKLRSRKFCEFYEHEWNVLWALVANAFTFDKMKTCMQQWIVDVKEDQNCFKSFYLFVFDYLLGEKGGRATALEKSDAINAWCLVHQLRPANKKWRLFDQWKDYWNKSDSKGVNRDCWKMLIPFMEKQKDVSDPKQVVFDEDDMWPMAIEDFVYFLRGEAR